MNRISTDALLERMKAGEAVRILDVRETDEFAEGHIPGALNIPLSILPVRMDELSKDGEWYIVCRSGARSAMACDFLEERGWKVANVEGGMLDWSGEVR